jgi:alpha-glucosidase
VPGYGLNRDPERVPMRWDGTRSGGFTTGEPWLPMGHPNPRNVSNMEKDGYSILHLYRQLISLRKQTPALRSGGYAPLRSRDDVLALTIYLDRKIPHRA